MCDWPGGPNELANYAGPSYPNRGTVKNLPQNKAGARGFAVDSANYEYIGKAETSLIDTGTMMWLCKRCGSVVAHQEWHERSYHDGR